MLQRGSEVMAVIEYAEAGLVTARFTRESMRDRNPARVVTASPRA